MAHITGTAGDDRGATALHGTTGDDVIDGLAGNDELDGGLGADKMRGGTGDDTYYVDNAADVVTEYFEQGTDNVISSVSFTLGASVENLTLTGTNNLTATGNNLANVLTGNAGANIIDGSTGADTMSGGKGDDTYYVDNIGDIVTEATGKGTDSIFASVSYSLAGQFVENLTLTGAANLNATGNSLANSLTGNAGHNSLDGGLGADTMAGGLGNDTYRVDNAGDVVTELAGEGTDTVITSVSYTLSANVENLTLAAGGAANGTGNVLDNILLGNGGNNTLDGGAGNDTIDGGAGSDVMRGGTGNDTYYVNPTLDLVTELAGQGTDTVLSDWSFTLGDNLENLTLIGTGSWNGTGNALDNILIGNGSANLLDGGDGNDTLNGGAGADTMRGGTGNDTYYVDDVHDDVKEYFDHGTDRVISSLTYVLGASVENLTLTGGTDIDGTGNNLDNVIIGNAGKNTFIGGTGNDTLDGGAGADNMMGGAGDDRFYVDNLGDIVGELPGEGKDSVWSSVTFTLSDEVENLTLTGSGPVNGTGNALDNVLTGNTGVNVLVGGDGKDTLDGGMGADKMKGGQGDDTYYVDNAGDAVTEYFEQGVDRVFSSVSFTLGASVEHLTLTGTASTNATGNNLDNSLTGNSGDNVLDGGTGADAMTGGLGDDSYYVDNAADIVSENVGAGTDTVHASVNYTLGNYVENLILTGDGNIGGTGNNAQNSLTGNAFRNTLLGKDGNDILDSGAGDDKLDGGKGADTMYGGAGNDLYIVDNFADVVSELSLGVDQGGVDTIQSSVTQILAIGLENLTLTGTANIDGTGNAGDNVITGNSGINVLIGGDGNDTIEGGGNPFQYDQLGGGDGNDVLSGSYANFDGGRGADTMTGFGTFVVDNVGDVIVSTGYSSIRSSISYTLGANMNQLTLTGDENLDGTGNSLNNWLTGNSGDNVLDGAGGVDTVNYSAAGSGLNINLATGIATGAGIGHDTLIGIEIVIAGNGNATLIGDAGANTLQSAGTNNVLDGGAGADTLIGYGGNNIFYVDNIDDRVYASGQGNIIYSSVSYTMAPNVKATLTLTGTDNLSATGNTYQDVLIGNTGANILDGRAGIDALTGGLGADEFFYSASQIGAGEQISDFSSDQGDIIHIVSPNDISPDFSQSGSDVIIALDQTHFIIVAGVTLDNAFLTHVEINNVFLGT